MLLFCYNQIRYIINLHFNMLLARFVKLTSSDSAAVNVFYDFTAQFIMDTQMIKGSSLNDVTAWEREVNNFVTTVLKP